MLAATVACGASTAPAPSYPSTGLVLLSLSDGSVGRSATIGTDPVAVTVSDDGKTAYVADSAPGDVYAVSLPDLKVRWRSHVGGAPFGILFFHGRPYVTLFDTAEVVQLNPVDGSVIARDATAPHPAGIVVDESGEVVVASGSSFGIAVAGGVVWTADYKASLLHRRDQAGTIPLPLPVHPFWLAAGAPQELLIAAEGESEDTDPGAVFSFDTVKGTFATLARPRDPDQVAWAQGTVFVSAHGEEEVLAIRRGSVRHWARGAAAVALAPDPALGLLVVAVNSHE
jgi:DNA-binding beta-propeller fold protein YncE